MRGRTRYALPIIIAFATPASIVIMPTTDTANAAETCLASPKLPGPAGSRWYYRLDHANNERKCWHLVLSDRKAPSATAKATPQFRPARRLAAATAADIAADEKMNPEARDPRQLVTKDASNVAPDDANVAPDDALVIPPVEPQATTEQQTASMSASAEQTNAPTDVSNLSPPVERPVPRTSAASVVDDAPTSMLQYAFLAFVLIGLGGGAVLYVAEIRRHRNDVLQIMQRSARVPREGRMRSEDAALRITGLDDFGLRDGVERAGQRLTQLRARRAV